MADYNTQASFAFVASPLAAKWFNGEQQERLSEAGFTMLYQKSKMVMFTEECGDLEMISELLSEYLTVHDPKSSILFTFAETCSKPRINAFSGGAVKITAEGFEVKTAGDLFEEGQWEDDEYACDW